MLLLTVISNNRDIDKVCEILLLLVDFSAPWTAIKPWPLSGMTLTVYKYFLFFFRLCEMPEITLWNPGLMPSRRHSQLITRNRHLHVSFYLSWLFTYIAARQRSVPAALALQPSDLMPSNFADIRGLRVCHLLFGNGNGSERGFALVTHCKGAFICFITMGSHWKWIIAPGCL